MSEIVVYEDSPMAEYLQSVDKPETTVKVAPLNLTNNKTNDSSISKRPSISRMWRHSIFHVNIYIQDAFSISLPKTEEAAFEEKFKYLVVTSPLLNEVLTFHHNKQRHRFTEHLTFQTNGATKLGVTSNLVATLMLLFGVERYTLRPRIPLITLTCSTSASLFYIYRHKRRSSVRQLYQSILSKLQSFIEQCDTFDTKVQRVLITIQEIELVSRGYRLSTPLSPISRIEQNSKQRKCIHLRSRLASILRRAFIAYEEGIIDLVNVIDKEHLLSLFEMYNVHSVASLSAVDSSEDSYSLDQLKKLTQIMHLKRRECMVHFLALGTDIDQHGWKIVNDILNHFLKEIENFTKEMVEALDAEFYKPINTFDAKTSKIMDSRLKLFIHRLSSLEQELRTLEAKVYLCNESVRQLSPESAEETKEKLLSDYLSVQKVFQNMLLEWENGKEALQSYLELPSATVAKEETKAVESAQIEEEEIQDESEGKGIILDSEDVADILNLPSKASVYEAIAGVVEKNGKERPKKSRDERIQEMKLKRAQEVHTEHMALELEL
ncbi:hypothetical protein CU097_011623 [Rhizopus azygosporus]|uniref:Vezatin n=1 Tax=Rhizopus azygosporus TaxID=86630 RepID=A0A367K6Y5_RHIAZ|nr:hypothetical protein CU097_011623 [Rhizopus azygosporus]